MKNWPALALSIAIPALGILIFAAMATNFKDPLWGTLPKAPSTSPPLQAAAGDSSESPLYLTTNASALVLALSAMLPALLVATHIILAERQEGTLRRLGRSPLVAWEYVVTKLAPVTAMAVLTGAVATLFAALAGPNFLPPEQGHISDHAVATFLVLTLLALSSGCLGLLTGALVKTSRIADNAASGLLLLMIVTSGFIRPVESLGVVRGVGLALPLANAYSGLYSLFGTNKTHVPATGANLAVLAGLSLAYVVICWIVLSRRDFRAAR